jgi:hypothetical protein
MFGALPAKYGATGLMYGASVLMWEARSRHAVVDGRLAREDVPLEPMASCAVEHPLLNEGGEGDCDVT